MSQLTGESYSRGMEACHIKQEPNSDICNIFEAKYEFNYKAMSFKLEEAGLNCIILRQPIKYEFCTDDSNEKNLLTDNNSNTIIKHESEAISKEDEDSSEDEDFELRLSDSSVEGEVDEKNISMQDLRDVTNKFKCAKINETQNEFVPDVHDLTNSLKSARINETQNELVPDVHDLTNSLKSARIHETHTEFVPDLHAVITRLRFAKINETPSESNARRKKAPTAKEAANKTPRRAKTMKQTSLLSYISLDGSPSIETTKKAVLSRKSSKVKSKKPIIDSVEMRKITSARVVLERLPDNVLETFWNSKGKPTLIYRHCAKCKKEYPDLTILSNNRCEHCSEAIVFRCGQCNSVYDSHSSVRYHLRFQCFVRTEFKCNQCEFASAEKDELRKHEKAAHNNKDMCQKCQIVFYNQANLRRHQKLYCSKKKVLSCKACNFKTTNIIALRSHQLTHRSESEESLVQPYCATCQKISSKFKVTRKCPKCKKLLNFECTKCHLTFTTRKEAENHANTHKSTKYPCEKCSKEFSNRQNLKRHKELCGVK